MVFIEFGWVLNFENYIYQKAKEVGLCEYLADHYRLDASGNHVKAYNNAVLNKGYYKIV